MFDSLGEVPFTSNSLPSLAWAGIASLAFVLLWLAVSETVNKDDQTPNEETLLILGKELIAE
jgi:hypothetical protein